MLGNRSKVKVVKNKVAPPFKQAEFDIMYGEGISKAGDILDCATEAGLIDKAGSWYSYDGNRIGQGRENVKVFLLSNPEIMDKLEGQLLDSLRRERNAYAGYEDDSVEEPLVDEDGVIQE